jgi:hypothetical protein
MASPPDDEIVGGEAKPAFSIEAAREYHEQRGAAVAVVPVAPGNLTHRPHWHDYDNLPTGFAAACFRIELATSERKAGALQGRASSRRHHR